MKHRAAAMAVGGLFLAGLMSAREASAREKFPTNLRVGVAEVVAGTTVMVVTSPVRSFCTVLLFAGQLNSPPLTLGEIWRGSTPGVVPPGLQPLAELHRWTNARIFTPFGAGIRDGLYQIGIGNGAGRGSNTTLPNSWEPGDPDPRGGGASR